MKKQTLFVGFFILSVILNAQEVISVQGDSYDNGTNRLDYTIGETVIETVSNGTNEMTQGFHQTFLTVTNIEDLAVDFLVNVFPNPTAKFITLTVEKYEDLTLYFYDVTGKLLKQAVLTQRETHLNVSEFPKGNYLLTLTHEGNKKLKTFKLIKN